MKLFKDCFTGVDNETYDLGRILGALSIISFIAFTYLSLPPFHPMEFAGGIGTILGSCGIMLKIKETTEPKK